MDAAGGRPAFFIHIMKTAGTSVRRMLIDALGPDAVYPNEQDLDAEPRRWYPDSVVTAARLPRLVRERDIRVVAGHHPWVLVNHLPWDDVATFTFLRDPVKRAISMAEHRRWVRSKAQGREVSLDDVLADEDFVARQIRDYQTKTFALDSIEDSGHGTNRPLPIDDELFERAAERLRSVDVVGLVERFDESMRRVGTLLGVEFPQRRTMNIGGYGETDRAATERLRGLVPYDVRLYQLAATLFDETTTERGAVPRRRRRLRQLLRVRPTRVGSKAVSARMIAS